MYTIIDKKELPSTDGYSKSGPVLFNVFADSADDVAVFDNDHPDASPGSVITVLSGDGEEKKYKKQNDGDYVELVESGGGGGGADWDAAEGEPGYIANKPFYEYEEPEQYSFDFDETGYWLGSPEYSCYDNMSLDSEEYQEVISIFKDNSIQEITLSFAGGDFVFTRSEEYDPDYRFDSIVDDQICAYIYYDDEYDDHCELGLAINADCVTDYIPDYPGTPENPVAFGVVPISFVKDSVSKLDQKYVPNADWDVNDKTAPGYIANKPFYDVSEDYDKELELNDPWYESEVNHYVDAPYYDDGIEVSDSDSYYNDIAALADQSCESVTIYFPGESVTLFLDDYYEEGGYRHATFLNGEETVALRINAYGAAGGGGADLYVYVNESVITTLFPMYDEPPQEEIPFGTLRITAPVKVGDVKKLDQKYVPNADWNASEGEDGYVKNRPFYEDYEVIEYDSTPLSVTFPGSDLGNGPAPGVYELPLDEENFIGPFITNWGASPYHDTGFARVTIGDTTTDLKIWTSGQFPDADSAGQFMDSDTAPTLILIGAVGESNYAYIWSTGTVVIPRDDTPITIELVGPVVHKIDKKYLPDDVGVRVVQLYRSEFGYYEPPSDVDMSEVYADVEAGKPVMFAVMSQIQGAYNYPTTITGLCPAYIANDLDSSGNPTVSFKLRFNQASYYHDATANSGRGGYIYNVSGWEYRSDNNTFFKMETVINH